MKKDFQIFDAMIVTLGKNFQIEYFSDSKLLGMTQ